MVENNVVYLSHIKLCKVIEKIFLQDIFYLISISR